MANSQIITNLPVRVVDQVIANVLVKYPLMDLVTRQVVTNGIKQIFYKDYRDTDGKSGFSDVEISDFNQGTEPVFSEEVLANTEIHKGYDILSNVLNDVTITPGLFLAIIADFTYAVARPFAKKYYSRFLTFLDTTASYDEVISFTGTDAKDKAKEVFEKITTLETPSRKHLKKLPTGATKGLEYSLDSSNAVLILNKKYAMDYKYDLAAGTFQMGEIKLPVSQVVVKDFDLFEEYSESKTKILSGLEVILMEKGVYEEIVHYSATKEVITPKMKNVFHRYDRVGNFRWKNKVLIAFKNTPAK